MTWRSNNGSSNKRHIHAAILMAQAIFSLRSCDTPNKDDGTLKTIDLRMELLFSLKELDDESHVASVRPIVEGEVREALKLRGSKRHDVVVLASILQCRIGSLSLPTPCQKGF